MLPASLSHLGTQNEIENIEQISKDCSQYSLTGDIPLPPLGGRTSRRHKLRRYIISPSNRRYRFWETFLVFLVFYTAWVCPFEFGFLQEPKGAFAITDNVVNGFFAIDIVLTFFVAFLDKSSYLLIDDPKLIAKRYAKTWLAFDVISSIPSEAARSVLPRPLKTYGYFNILRLWRIRRVGAVFARLEKDRNYNYFLVRCLKLICVTLFQVHMAACIIYFLSSGRDPESTWFGIVYDHENLKLMERYVASVYWALVTFTTVGYGDLHPVNWHEMLFDICYMLVNVGLYSYIIGNMTSMIVHWTSRTRNYRDTIQAASGFAQRNQLPIRLQEQMLSHLFMKYRTDLEGLQQQEIIDSLPKAIRSSISHNLFSSLIDKVYLFRGVSPDLLFQLVTEMKAEYFPPKEDVILQNEAPTDFYILVTGAVELIVQKNGIEQVVGEAMTGHVVGEIGVLCYRPQLFTVRTKRLSQLLRLNRTTLVSLCQANVGDGTIIMNNFLQHLQELHDPMMDRVLAETEAMLTRGKTDLPISLCFAANRGDDLLLHQLLKKGSDPNEADTSRRTALHIAAAKGNEHCVVLLLEYGADLNSKDIEGSIPLWEAMMGKHASIIKLLLDNGADITCADVGHLACTAAQLNNIELLKEIIEYGGDVTKPKSDETTALHAAVCEGNTEMVKFLMEQGADIDKPDVHGWTPRALADHQGHEEINVIFQERKKSSEIPKPKICGFPNFKMLACQRPTTFPYGNVSPASGQRTWLSNYHRRMSHNYNNSLFGVMSAVKSGNSGAGSHMEVPARITLSCPDKGENGGKLVFVPNTIQELLDIGSEKFHFSATKILTPEGAEVEDLDLIRDGDHLILACHDRRDSNLSRS